MSKNYKEATEMAIAAVKDIQDPDLKKSAFEVILRDLLNADPSNIQSTHQETKGASGTESAQPNTGQNKTGLTDEEIDTLFNAEGDVLTLKVRPTGDSVPKQQQMLAHAVLVGYKAVFGKDTVPSLTMVTAARDWNLMDRHFAENVRAPGHIQTKGIKKGAVYSLRPGAMAKLKESMQKMARGE